MNDHKNTLVRATASDGPLVVPQWGFQDYNPPEDLLLSAWELIVRSVLWGAETYEDIDERYISDLDSLPFAERLEGARNGVARLRLLAAEDRPMNEEEVGAAFEWFEERTKLYLWWVAQESSVTDRTQAAGRS